MNCILSADQRRVSKNNMFCSEIIGNIYQELGILKSDRHPRYYTPQDFIQNKDIYKSPYSVEDVVYFKYDKEMEDTDTDLE